MTEYTDQHGCGGKQCDCQQGFNGFLLTVEKCSNCNSHPGCVSVKIFNIVPIRMVDEKYKCKSNKWHNDRCNFSPGVRKIEHTDGSGPPANHQTAPIKGDIFGNVFIK